MYPLLKKWKCPSLEKSNHSSEFCVSHSFLFILVLSHLYVCLYIPHQLANYLMKMFCLCCTASAAPAAAKSLQSCPTLCDPIDGSPPGSPVPGILQARTLEWVAISFSNA